MKRMQHIALAGLAALALWSTPAAAQESTPAAAQESATATPEEVITKVLQAVRYLEQTGKAGFAEFNDVHGRWSWKDSYVFLYNCSKNEMIAHPLRPDLVGRPLLQIKDDNGKPIFKELCDAGNKPQGGWVEYAWTKPGEGGVSRKISYAHSARVSFEYGVQAAAGIHDEKYSVQELTDLLNAYFDPEKYRAL